MEKKKYSIKEDFSMLALLIIPVGVAVNFVGGQLASILKLPMYLDTIGTIFAAMLCGPWVGAVTGGLTNVVTGIANPVNFAFIPVNVIAGLVTGFLARKQMFSVWWKWLISMFVMAWVLFQHQLLYLYTVELQVEVHLLSQQPQWQQEPTSGQHSSVQKEYSRY